MSCTTVTIVATASTSTLPVFESVGDESPPGVGVTALPPISARIRAARTARSRSICRVASFSAAGLNSSPTWASWPASLIVLTKSPSPSFFGSIDFQLFRAGLGRAARAAMTCLAARPRLLPQAESPSFPTNIVRLIRLDLLMK